MTSLTVPDISPRIQYESAALQTEFAVPFAFFENGDLVVIVDGETKTLTTDYTVAGAGSGTAADRKVTFVTGQSDGAVVTIFRDVPVGRTSNFSPSGSLRASVLNEELNRLTAFDQQAESAIARALGIPDEDPDGSATAIPAKISRASRLLAFDANGAPKAGPLETDVTDLVTAVSDTAASQAAAAASATAAASSATSAASDAEDISSLVQNIPQLATMTGDGADTTLTLPAAPVDEKALLVTLDGILQHTSAFSVSGTTLTFSAAPPTGVAIEVRDLSSTAVVNAADVSTLAAIASAISTVAGMNANVTTVAANDSDISDVADDLNGANTIGAAVTSASNAASSASAAATSATNAGNSATAAAAAETAAETAETNAEAAQTAAEAAQTAAETAETNAETAQAAAETAETGAETAETNAAASETAAAASASGAAAAVADASGAAARSGFRSRFGKTPPEVLPFYLGDVSGLTLTRATVGTAINEAGGPAEVAIDTARIEHDIDTSERLGLLLEPAATNICKYSADPTQWVLGTQLSRVGGKVDPLGGTSAARITASASGTASASNYVRLFLTGLGATTGTYTVWVRRVTGTGTVRLLQTQNGVSGTDITSELTSEWKRFQYSGAANGGGTLYFGVGVTVSGDEVDVAFMHCEADITGDASSFIETDASTATRSADVATVDLSALTGFRPAAFTLIAEVIIRATDGVIMDIGTGSTSEVALDMQSGDLHVTGADSLDLTAASGLSIGDRLLVALRVQPDNVAVSVNGAAVVTDSSHALNGDADELQLGANISGSDPMPCVIQHVAFFGPIPDATLEAMSNV